MCDWSSWKWLCEGHYEIALTILLVVALIVALTMMMILSIDNGRRADTRDKALDSLRESLDRGEINPDDFLRRCNEAANISTFSVDRASLHR